MKSLVKKVSSVELLTGKRNKNDASELVRENLIAPYVSKNWQKHENALVQGTDLGIPFYNSKNNTMYVLFGDTFGRTKPKSKTVEEDDAHWRSSVMAISKDYDLSDG